jgi:hypothetical protein
MSDKTQESSTFIFEQAKDNKEMPGCN